MKGSFFVFLQKNNSKMSDFIPYQAQTFSDAETAARSQVFYEYMDTRRSIRTFSERAVARQTVEQILMTASSAPSGAHKQPWTFCAVEHIELKSQIRKAAEAEEYTNYHGRMSEEWLQNLVPFATDWQKTFLETAPWLIIVFKKSYDIDEAGKQHKNYYVTESVGIACGFLLAAIHQAGLVSLTHTPSPMNFLQKILNRPENEKPFLLIPIGYAQEGVEVPNIKRKTAEDVIKWF
jgi:iodotyrosine deiodinase